MKSVSIVGLGWLGLPLARHLKNLGWEVKGSKRTHEGAEQMRLVRLEAYPLELTPEINADPDDLTLLLSVDSLVINIPPSQYFFDPQHYVQGIQHLVNEALLHGVSHLIFISSTSVFPEHSGYFDESCSPQPQSEIAKALVEVEEWLFQLKNIDCDIIRFGGLIGDDRHPVYSLAGKDVKAGNSPVNLVHFDDCARAIQLLLETPSHQRLYHVVAPKHPTKAEYYSAMAEKLGVATPNFICSEQDPVRIIVSDKICQEIDFVYQYPDPYLMLPNEEKSGGLSDGFLK
ncbi:TPA: SDR family oxidoreductase [Pasteurella multocida]|uniref:SDR family oxidoreductase n=1 Tax=Pasteurella multocida TaxID=747 RepID=UPI0007EDBFB7|nr:SDR family oxidoreductase [Pasteurella multocida]MCL7789691.1 SDR family oxidoreductase [Pasteurella multocida]MDO5071365.1 SDR family oxidoreductase [Pasteurella multocida]OBP30974.1 NAD(P)-dependent oxidoreductase [Pasteurella multocida subsp. multocida]PNM07690.1 SDR family NAD(P)-dependent oxidoreductase [Pasteurella multocida]WND44785.1 SDR family oxidoreductase [Pasteurella multocida]